MNKKKLLNHLKQIRDVVLMFLAAMVAWSVQIYLETRAR